MKFKCASEELSSHLYGFFETIHIRCHSPAEKRKATKPELQGGAWKTGLTFLRKFAIKLKSFFREKCKAVTILFRKFGIFANVSVFKVVHLFLVHTVVKMETRDTRDGQKLSSNFSSWLPQTQNYLSCALCDHKCDFSLQRSKSWDVKNRKIFSKKRIFSTLQSNLWHAERAKCAPPWCTSSAVVVSGRLCTNPLMLTSLW